VEVPGYSDHGVARRLFRPLRDSQSPQTKLVRMPVVGGVTTELNRNVNSAVTCSPDAQRLAFLRNNAETKQSSIIIADAADGRNERTLATRQWPQNFSSAGLSWSPDGKTIAVGAAKGDGGRNDLLAVSIADGDVRRIGDRDWGFIGKVAWSPDGEGILTAVAESAGSHLNAYLNSEPLLLS
jgi:dipeptidyl aminopeptidase/acylaminoacyl peptidase